MRPNRDSYIFSEKNMENLYFLVYVYGNITF